MTDDLRVGPQLQPTPESGSRFAVWALVSWLAITAALWCLAFVSVPQPPKWLAAAREVCFGTLANGLPDSWGWITLIAGPLGVLGFLLAVWGRDLIVGLRGLATTWMGRGLLAVLILVPLLGLSVVAQRVVAARAATFAVDDPGLPTDLPSGYPRTDRPAPELGLIDQYGQVVNTEQLRGRPTVVTFAYAHCATICPRIVYTAKQAIENRPDLDARLVVVSLDPWRDTPSSLPGLVDAWRLQDLSAHLLSGEIDQVLAALDRWNMPIERDESTGEITHPGLVYTLDAQGDIAFTFNSPSASWIEQALERSSS